MAYTAPRLPPGRPRPNISAFHQGPKAKARRWKPSSNNGWVIGPPAPKPAAAAPAAAPSPAAPAPAAPQGPAQLPVDPVYDNAVAGAGHRRDDTYAALNNEQTGTLGNYGYSAAFDSAGNVTGLTFDPNNPYSRAALLRKNYQQSKTGTANNMASRGQLYAGAFGQGQNIQDNRYQQGENDLQKGLTGALGGIANRRRTAGTDYETAVSAAGADRVARASASDTGSSAAAGDAGGDYGPAPAAAPKGLPAEGSTLPNGAKVHYDLGKGGVWHIYPNGRRVYQQLRK